VFDDDPGILQSINSMLNDRYTVYTVPGAKDEKKIREVLKKVTPDLFLLDCNMPVISGFRLASILRSMQEYEETPIMFLTADGSMDNMMEAMNFEACEFFTKPVDRADLREKLEMHLKDFMLRRRMR
jgi:DNA-binding response OmpR family regulator